MTIPTTIPATTPAATGTSAVRPDLLEAMARHATSDADAYGLTQTAIPNLVTVWSERPSDLVHAVMQPLVCLLVQGAKDVTMGTQTFSFSAGDSLLITADVPVVSQITRASRAAPYFSLVLLLDLSMIAELTAQMDGVATADDARLRVEPTDREVADAGLRLLNLLDRPAALPVLKDQLVREMHYWLLAGRLGPAIRRLGWPDGHAQRIARAVAVLRTEFASPIKVERLAEVAGMSPSSFHHHFRAVTSLSPLQFQKHLRLIEARRQMLTDGASPSRVAFAVGYESVPQFTREYGRLFGLSPLRDRKAALGKTLVAA